MRTGTRTALALSLAWLTLAATGGAAALLAGGPTCEPIEGAWVGCAWAAHVSSPTASPVLSADGRFLLTLAGNAATLRDAATGTPLWTYASPSTLGAGALHALPPSPEGPHGATPLAPNAYLLDADRSVVALDGATGAVLWRAPLWFIPSDASPVALAADGSGLTVVLLSPGPPADVWVSHVAYGGYQDQNGFGGGGWDAISLLPDRIQREGSDLYVPADGHWSYADEAFVIVETPSGPRLQDAGVGTLDDFAVVPSGEMFALTTLSAGVPNATATRLSATLPTGDVAWAIDDLPGDAMRHVRVSPDGATVYLLTQTQEALTLQALRASDGSEAWASSLAGPLLGGTALDVKAANGEVQVAFDQDGVAQVLAINPQDGRVTGQQSLTDPQGPLHVRTLVPSPSARSTYVLADAEADAVLAKMLQAR